MAGLVAWRDQLAGPGGAPTFHALCFLENERAVAFAALGGGDPAVRKDDRGFDVPWATIRTALGVEVKLLFE